jgi:hypothetical protein
MNIRANGAPAAAAGWTQCRSVTPRRVLRRRCLQLWMVATTLWLVAVCVGLGWIIGNEVSAGRDLAYEIAQLDCTADSAPCPASAAKSAEWADVADLIWTFGSSYVLAALLLPPALLLALGAGVLLCRRERRHPLAG